MGEQECELEWCWEWESESESEWEPVWEQEWELEWEWHRGDVLLHRALARDMFPCDGGPLLLPVSLLVPIPLVIWMSFNVGIARIGELGWLRWLGGSIGFTTLSDSLLGAGMSVLHIVPLQV